MRRVAELDHVTPGGSPVSAGVAEEETPVDEGARRPTNEVYDGWVPIIELFHSGQKLLGCYRGRYLFFGAWVLRKQG